MIINFENRELIDKQKIHDSLFMGFIYDYQDRKLSFSCSNIGWGNEFDLVFNNVVFFDMQSCNFWGPGPHILCMYLDDTSHKIDDLTKHAKNNGYIDTKLDKGINYITVGFEFNSGDVLEIICENIELNETTIDTSI